MDVKAGDIFIYLNGGRDPEACNQHQLKEAVLKAKESFCTTENWDSTLKFILLYIYNIHMYIDSVRCSFHLQQSFRSHNMIL